MNRLAIILWIINVMLDTGGQLAFKFAASNSVNHDGLGYWNDLIKRPWVWLGIGCYAIEFFVWLAFIALVPLSVGVMLGTINTVVIMLAGRLWFKEQLTSWRVLGIILICCGVAIVGFPS